MHMEAKHEHSRDRSDDTGDRGCLDFRAPCCAHAQPHMHSQVHSHHSHSSRPPGLPADSQRALCELQPRGAVRIPSSCAIGATQPGFARDPSPLSSGSAQDTGVSRVCAHVRPVCGTCFVSALSRVRSQVCTKSKYQ